MRGYHNTCRVLLHMGHRGGQTMGGDGKDADRWMSFSRWDLRESEGDASQQSGNTELRNGECVPFPGLL